MIAACPAANRSTSVPKNGTPTIPPAWSRGSGAEAALPQQSPSAGTNATNNKVLAALPLGGRIKMDPWNDELTMLKAKPVSIVAEREKMPFEVTPFVIYLSREQSRSQQQVPAVAAESRPEGPTAATQSSAIAGGPADPAPADPSPETK